MTEKKTSSPYNTTREERLAAALRENLKRRKVQARAWQGAEDGQEPDQDAAHKDD